jgi:hypothetical protein
MSNCLPETELKQLGNSMIMEFERRVASIPDYLCAPFHQEARQLEAELLTIYKMVALCAKKDEDLDVVSKRWGSMVQMCDSFAKQLHQLTQKHPHCGADAYYDRVLDLRNKCYRLQQMHS